MHCFLHWIDNYLYSFRKKIRPITVQEQARIKRLVRLVLIYQTRNNGTRVRSGKKSREGEIDALSPFGPFPLSTHASSSSPSPPLPSPHFQPVKSLGSSRAYQTMAFVTGNRGSGKQFYPLKVDFSHRLRSRLSFNHTWLRPRNLLVAVSSDYLNSTFPLCPFLRLNARGWGLNWKNK